MTVDRPAARASACSACRSPISRTSPPGSFSHIFRLDSAALKGLIDKTQFAISTEETRYYLNGIYLHTHRDRRQAEAARRRDRRPPPGPRRDRCAGRLRGHAGHHHSAQDGRANCRSCVDDRRRRRSTIELSDTKIRFTIGGVVLTSKLIDGTFPDYQRVIPTRQRQEADHRPPDVSPQRRRPRLDHFVGARPRGEAVDCRTGR